MLGYFEEQAGISYTQYHRTESRAGEVENIQGIPAIAFASLSDYD